MTPCLDGARLLGCSPVIESCVAAGFTENAMLQGGGPAKEVHATNLERDLRVSLRRVILREPIITVAGLRGVIGESVSPLVALRYACAFAAQLPSGPMLLARDGRDSGQMLTEAVQSGLVAVGRSVLYADVAATPTVGILIRQHGCAGGIQISASHNPPEYNGLKLISDEGRVIGARTGEAVLEQYREGEPRWAPHDRVGRVAHLDDTTSEHCRRVLATVDANRIRRRGFRVVLDSNHGAGSLLGRQLLSELGCDVHVIGGEPDGQFSHPAEPLEENLRGVGTTITEAGADVGFCQDPDADRLAVIDETGRYVGEEYTLAMCLDHLLRHEPGPVVTNCSSSRMSQDVATKYGVPCSMARVGELNVVEEMLATEAVFGGEGNGGTIDPRVGYIRDSFVGMAQLLDAMADRDKKISQLADELPQYTICKTKVSLDREKVPDALDALQAHFSDAVPNHLDGLRLDWPTAWLVIRGSNTEPIVRVVAEAKTGQKGRQLCDQAKEVIDRF